MVLPSLVNTFFGVGMSQDELKFNVSIERLDARSKIRKKLLHSNDVARGAKAIDT